MPIKKIAAVNAKGGAGKTNFCFYAAQALARCGYRVYVMDADEQQACVEILSLPIHQHPNIRVGDTARPPDGYTADLILVDTEGKSALESVLRVLPSVDLLVIPSGPNAVDVRQLGYTIHTLSESVHKDTPHRLLWNRIDLAARTEARTKARLDGYSLALQTTPLQAIIPYSQVYASMEANFEKIRPIKRRDVWSAVATEIIGLLKLSPPGTPHPVEPQSVPLQSYTHKPPAPKRHRALKAMATTAS